MTLTQEQLMDVLHYNPDTGIFTWVSPTNRRIKAGDVAGTINCSGYSRTKVLGQEYLAHRLAWLYVTGAWPTGMVDHVNCNPLDNRFANLRIATNSQNLANQRLNSRNTSGFKGVTSYRGRWRATLVKNRKSNHLGYFDTPLEAHEAYCAAAKVHFGEFARAA